MGINGEHISHHRFILQYFLSLHEINLSRSAHWHFLLNNYPLDQARVSRGLSRLDRLVLRTLSSIVAFLATLETSTRLVPLSLTRWGLLSLGLLMLHLLSRCTILSGRCLKGLLRLSKRMPTRRLIGHPPDNMYLLHLGMTRRPSSHPLALPFCLRVPLQALHGNSSVHHRPKGLIVSCI